MSQFCQIEHGFSDSDIGTPCSNRAVANALTAEPRSVSTVELGVAANRSVNVVAIITQLLRA